MPKPEDLTKVKDKQGKVNLNRQALGREPDHSKQKRQVQYGVPINRTTPVHVETICEPQGLASPPHAFHESFTLGSQSDSLYEYLPKVGSLVDLSSFTQPSTTPTDLSVGVSTSWRE